MDSSVSESVRRKACEELAEEMRTSFAKLWRIGEDYIRYFDAWMDSMDSVRRNGDPGVAYQGDPIDRIADEMSLTSGHLTYILDEYQNKITEVERRTSP